MSSAFHCGLCGRNHWGAHRCPKSAIDRIERERQEFDEDDQPEPFVFDNCNVCGRKLRDADEDKMGMCFKCASE